MKVVRLLKGLNDLATLSSMSHDYISRRQTREEAQCTSDNRVITNLDAIEGILGIMVSKISQNENSVKIQPLFRGSIRIRPLQYFHDLFSQLTKVNTT